MTKEDLCILRLYRSENIGAVCTKYLMQKYETAENAIKNVHEMSQYIKGKKVQLASIESIDQEVEKLLNYGGKFVSFLSKDYPVNLSYYHDSSPILSYIGDLTLCKKNVIAVIGSRLASLVGIKFCTNVCQNLGNNNFVICSGMALGIDHAAHMSAIKTGTIAILPCGINIIYPINNRECYEQIQENGLLLSDQPFNTKPINYLFPKRNNIIAAISDYAILVESTINSGALITANRVLSLNKSLFIVASHPYDLKYSGNLQLLQNQQGQILFNDRDVVHLIRNTMREKPEPIQEDIFTNFEIQYVQIVQNLLSNTPIAINEISKYTNIPINQVISILIEMQICGIAKIENNSAIRIYD